MKIVFVSHYAFPHVGGVEGVVHHVAEELCRRGHELEHVTSDSDAERGEPPQTYRVVRVPAWNAPERRMGVPYPVYAPRALTRALRRAIAGADVVHAHGFLYMGTAAGFAIARRERGRPVRVLSEHVGHVAYSSRFVDGSERLAEMTIGRVCARGADATVVHNDRVADEMRALAPAVPVHYVSNGVDTDLFRPTAGPQRDALRRELGWDDRPRLVFVGRPVAKKGIDVALGAAADVGDTCELVLVGDADPTRQLPSNARALGQQPREEVARILRAADVFVLPSQGEGLPLTILEAMASGLPVVVGDDPGYRRVLAGAGDGVRMVAPAVETVAATVRELIDSPDDRSRAGEAAATFAHQAFSWHAIVDEYEQLYGRLSEELRSESATT